MHKLMAVAMLGVAVMVGCDQHKDHNDTTDTKKMSIEGKSGDCSKSCDKSNKPA